MSAVCVPASRLDFRQAEVEYLHAVVSHENIARLEVAVRDLLAMRRIESTSKDLAGEPQCFFDRSGAMERLALDVFHDQVAEAIGRSRDVIDRTDVGWFSAAMTHISRSKRSVNRAWLVLMATNRFIGACRVPSTPPPCRPLPEAKESRRVPNESQAIESAGGRREREIGKRRLFQEAAGILIQRNEHLHLPA